MSANNPVQESVTDMLRVERESIDRTRQAVVDLMTEMQKEREQQQKLTELLADFVKEYDRLTDKVSTQIKALILAIEEIKNA